MIGQVTERQQVVLAALAAERGSAFAPVQVQKLFFLLDQNIAEGLGGKQFDFQPYDYGAFDKAVYAELEALERMGLVEIARVGPSRGQRQYSLTPDGQEVGERALAAMAPVARDYARTVSKWVRELPFAQLVGSIYKAYPWTRANSIFQE